MTSETNNKKKGRKEGRKKWVLWTQENGTELEDSVDLLYRGKCSPG